MKISLFVFTIFLTISSLSFGQQDTSAWGKLNYLLGSWVGEGSGQPGAGGGTFFFRSDLNDKVIIRNSHSEYPATNSKPRIVHDDLMIIYRNNSGNPERAIYFDNEGHVINYTVTTPNDSDIVFTSDKLPNMPIFKLTYSRLDNDLVDVKFEMSQDGVKFLTYVEGKSKRTK